MKPSAQNRFNQLYELHLRALKLQGMSHKTIDAYARALRRVAEYFNRCPDHLSTDQLASYFSDLVDSHSWSTVKVDRNGLQFFYKHVLNRDWTWVEIIKPSKIQSLPDILTLEEISRLIGATRKLRYRVFLLTTYSLGLRLSESLALQVGDIDGGRKQVHVRRGTKSRRFRRGLQGPAAAVARFHLSGAAQPVVQASPSAMDIPESGRFARARRLRHRAHGPRRCPGGDESRGALLWD
jgi:site-specific recombinase XerD